MDNSIVSRAFIVSGMPHILLGGARNPGWQSLQDSYADVRADLERSDAEIILYFSTQWLSVIGYLFQANPKPAWTLVDMDWHDLGSIPYAFQVDTEFPKLYAEEVGKFGHHTALVNYHGFPIDTGTVVAQQLLNPDNRLPAAMVSCNMYSEKNEMLQVGYAGARALLRSGKKAAVVLVSNLSNRFHVKEIDAKDDVISSAKDHEWNLKLLELLGEGRLEDVAQCARDAAREANGDMGFRGLWWLNALLGQSNHFKGHVYDYQPVWGSGAALVRLDPTKPVVPPDHLELESESEVIEEATQHEPRPRRAATGVAGEPLPLQPAAPPVSETKSATPTQPPPSQTDTRISTQAAPPPVGAYPHARREGDLLFLSGIGPRKAGTKEIPGVTFDGDGNVIAEDVALQTASVIENIHTILAASGSSIDKVVDVQVFLTNMKRDFATFNKVYAATFAEIGATRTTVEVKSLPTPIAVEFKVIAKA